MTILIDTYHFKNVCFNKMCSNFSRRRNTNCSVWIKPGKKRCPDYKTQSQWKRIVNK